MTQKSYYPLDNEQNVLALLQRGYSFLQVGSPIAQHTAAEQGEAVMLMEAIPHTEVLADQEYVLLSQFLKSAPDQLFHVDSRYFQSGQ